MLGNFGREFGRDRGNSRLSDETELGEDSFENLVRVIFRNCSGTHVEEVLGGQESIEHQPHSPRSVSTV